MLRVSHGGLATTDRVSCAATYRTVDKRYIIRRITPRATAHRVGTRHIMYATTESKKNPSAEAKGGTESQTRRPTCTNESRPVEARPTAIAWSHRRPSILPSHGTHIRETKISPHILLTTVARGVFSHVRTKREDIKAMYTTEWWPWYEDESDSFGPFKTIYGFSTRVNECYDMRCPVARYQCRGSPHETPHSSGYDRAGLCARIPTDRTLATTRRDPATARCCRVLPEAIRDVAMGR